MPEGPEIRLVADRLQAAIAGQCIDDVYFGLPRLDTFVRLILGTRIVMVESRGKALLTRFDNGMTLYSHNQLYGRWYIEPRGRLPKTNRSLRVALHTKSRSALLYSASDIDVLTDDQLAVHPFLCRIGPDILNESLTWRDLSRRLAQPEFMGRSLGSLYLDQGFLAGTGNYLRSEILYLSGLHPTRKPRELTRARRNQLARDTLATARRSYQTKGITNLDRWVHTLKAEGARRAHYRFAVFGRAGQPCHACQTTIERITVGSRRLYLCPSCQN